jgi:hypothetical protein
MFATNCNSQNQSKQLFAQKASSNAQLPKLKSQFSPKHMALNSVRNDPKVSMEVEPDSYKNQKMVKGLFNILQQQTQVFSLMSSN